MSRGPAAASQPFAAFSAALRVQGAKLVLHAGADVTLGVNSKALAGHAAHQMLQPGLLCGLLLTALRRRGEGSSWEWQDSAIGTVCSSA